MIDELRRAIYRSPYIQLLVRPRAFSPAARKIEPCLLSRPSVRRGHIDPNFSSRKQAMISVKFRQLLMALALDATSVGGGAWPASGTPLTRPVHSAGIEDNHAPSSRNLRHVPAESWSCLMRRFLYRNRYPLKLGMTAAMAIMSGFRHLWSSNRRASSRCRDLRSAITAVNMSILQVYTP